MQYRILGRLEAERNDALVDLGGFQQRALLAILLVERGRTVTLDRLVDELWADDPPKAAVHTVRVYVSQLRRVLGEATLETRDRGYGLRLEAGSLDAIRFEESVTSARTHAAGGDTSSARARFEDALELWHGPALAEFRDIPRLAGEAARLEEMRLGAEEDLVDIGLAQGSSVAMIPRLEELRSEHPRRERIAAQLMTALYRAGRQADALEVFDDTRRSLDELGLRPGEGLRRLQRQILEQDSALDPAPAEPSSADATPARRPLRLWAVAAGLVGLVALVVAAALASSQDRQASPPRPGSPARPVTLVLGGARPTGQPSDVVPSITTEELIGLRSAANTYHVPVRVAYGDYFKDLARAAGRSSVVLVVPDPGVSRIAAITRRHPNTVYVWLGGSIHDAAFGRNVVGMPFDDTEVGFLGGYLSALMAGRGHPSAVAGAATPEVQRIVKGFRAGVRAAARGMRSVVTYTDDFVHVSECARAANRQINHGATVVFDIAGGCGNGAVNAAGVRGVKAVGIDTDLSSLGPQVIGSVVKRFDSAVDVAIELESARDLRPGRDYTLNVGNQGVALVGLSPQVPSSVRLKLERVITQMTARDCRREHC